MMLSFEGLVLRSWKAKRPSSLLMAIVRFDAGSLSSAGWVAVVGSRGGGRACSNQDAEWSGQLRCTSCLLWELTTRQSIPSMEG